MDSSPAGQLSPEDIAWHERFMQALTSRDAADYLAFIHPDCSIQINNAMPVYSKLAIGHSYNAYLAAFRTVTVEVLALTGDARHIASESLLTYVCIDGSTEVVQCAYFLDRSAEGLITSVRVYGNATRVFKPFMHATK